MIIQVRKQKEKGKMRFTIGIEKKNRSFKITGQHGKNSSKITQKREKWKTIKINKKQKYYCKYYSTIARQHYLLIKTLDY